MTNVLAPGLLTGLAPPAGVTAGVAGKTSQGTRGPDPTGTFATLLAGSIGSDAAGGETQPPDGGALLPGSSTATLVEQMAALMHGPRGGDGAAEWAKTTGISQLDRSAGVGEIHEELGGPGAAEALMASLMMAQRNAEQPMAQPSLTDVRTSFAAVLGSGSGVFEGDGEHLLVAVTSSPSYLDLPVSTVTGGVTPAQPAILAGASDIDGGSLLPGLTGTETDAVVEELPAASPAGSSGPGAVAADGATGRDVSTTLSGREALPSNEAGVQPQAVADATVGEEAVGGERSGRTASAVAEAGQTLPPVIVPGSVATASNIETASAARAVNATAVPVEMAEVVTAAVLRGDSEVRLVLNPPELGELKVSIASVDGALRIAVEAAQAGARDLMERSLPALLQALEGRDLKVDRLEVRPTDTGRGSLDSSGSGGLGHDSASGSGAGDRQEARDHAEVEWSPVAALGGGVAHAVGIAGDGAPSKPPRQAVVDGHVDVLA